MLIYWLSATDKYLHNEQRQFVGNHQLEVAFLQSPFAIPTYKSQVSAFNSKVTVLVSPG